MAYATTGLSKIATAAVQLIAFPIVVHSVGDEKFGAMMTIAAIGSFIQIPAIGLSSSVGYYMSTALGRNDVSSAAKWLRSGLLVASVGMLAILAIGLSAVIWAPTTIFLGNEALNFSKEARLTLLVGLVQICGVYMFNMVEGVRASFHENYITNIYSFLAAVLTFFAVGATAFFGPSLPMFYFSMFVVIPIVQGLNLLQFVRGRSKEFKQALLTKKTDPYAIIGKTISYGKAQGGIVLHLHGFTYLTSNLVGLAAGGVVGAVIRIMVIMANMVQSFLNPIFPIISQSMASDDSVRLVRYFGISIVFSVLSATIIGAALYLFGDTILQKWLNIDVNPRRSMMVGFGLLAVSYLGSHLLFNILVYIGQSKMFGYVIGFSGLVGFSFSYMMMQDWGLGATLTGNAIIFFLFGFCCPFYVALKFLKHRLRLSRIEK